MLETGCDRLLRKARRLAGRPYGLLAHGAAVTAELCPLHLALAASEAGPPAALFAPEHGYYGVEQDMVASAGGRDPWTGAPILSLYGDDAGSLRPRREAFAGLEVLVVDLQDVGSRYYTYAATAVWAAEAALAAEIEVWILDRPNPLGGEAIEGNLPRPGYRSFVGAFDLPVRHGLTLGELVLLEARRRGWGDGLEVWALDGWRRSMRWPATGRPWIAPSPNMPTPETALVYPGSCLVEATALSEGRGTTRPFQLIGAPGIDPPALARALADLHLPGIRFLPTCFRPQFHKHRGELVGGVELVVQGADVFPAYRCGLELVATVHRLWGEAFAWRREPYEFVSERPAIDLLTGSDTFRRLLENDGDLAPWVHSFAADEAAFDEERREILLYS